MIFGACSDDTTVDIPSERTFWAIDFTYDDYTTNSSAWYQVDAELLATSNHAAVYAAKNENLSVSAAKALASQFDSNIYPKVTTYFASHYDVDGNGKVILLVHDIKYDYNGITDKSYLGGYFFSADYYSQKTVSAQYPAVKSNEGDILYIDCNPQVFTTEDAWRTVAHEFQHMVNFSYNVSREEDTLDTWIDEGFAEAANHLCYGEVTSRITIYNDDSNNDFKNGHPLFYWDNSNVLPNYSLSYLFFQYLRSQSSSGNGIFKKIIESSHGDDEAIIDAIAADSKLLAHGNNKEDAFDKLLLRWYATNAGVVLNNDLYKYDDQIDTTPLLELNTSSGTISMQSGAGIVRSMSGGDFSNTASGYIYLSVNSSGASEDFDKSDGITGSEYFVAVNRTYLPEDNSSKVTSLPSGNIIEEDQAAESSQSASRSMSGSTDSGPQKIDFIAPKGFAEALGPIKGEDK